LSSVFDSFTSAVQSLVTSPDSAAAQSQVVSSAQTLAQSLNSMTSQIQSLRSDAEGGLSDAVATANTAMQKIADLNAQLAGRQGSNASDAALMDQRDSYIDQLSQLMDIRVVTDSQNQVSVFTNSGAQLVGTQASQLQFNAQGTVTPAAQWNADPSKSTLGTLSLVSADGSKLDLIANHSIRSGTIAAYLEMRDKVLVQAQDQLDELASAMSSSLSDQTIAGSAVSSGAQNGFSVDVAGLLDGNSINLTYTDHQTNIQHHVTLVRVNDPSALPLSNAATNDPNDEVVGLDFSGGLGSVVSQLNARFGGAMTFSNPSGTTLQVLDDGAGNMSDVNALSVTQTATSLSGGSMQLSLFTDGNTPFSGAISGVGAQGVGYAGRITVNPALVGNASRLVLYGSGTAIGDPARPSFIYDQLTNATLGFSTATGLGNANAPFSGNLPNYLRQVLSQQGEAASSASSLAEGQDVVVNALQQRVNDSSGVNVDQEMANLISLQTAYGANARVMSAAKDMIDQLLNI
jgi:flagellar hook-associated protein 1 FlgK